MKRPIVLIGIGEIASVLARAFLRNEYPVFPVTRNMDISQAAQEVPDPLMVVVGVAEKDFPSTMQGIPEVWKDRLVLVQNELLPKVWEAFDIEAPTVLSIWFEKKKGMDTKPILPTPLFGPHAATIAASLQSIDIPSEVVPSEADMLLQLVQKNVYIFTINIAGLFLEDGATTSVLWEGHREMASKIAREVIELQKVLTGQDLSTEALLNGFTKAINGDPQHICKGRSAPGRLTRILQLADEKQVPIPYIRELSQAGN